MLFSKKNKKNQLRSSLNPLKKYNRTSSSGAERFRKKSSSIIKSPALLLTKAKEKLNLKAYIAIGVNCFLLVLVTIGYFVLFTDWLKIQRVVLYEGDKISQNPKFLQLAQTFRGDNLLLVTQNRVENLYKKSNLPIKSIRLAKDYPTELRIAIEPIPNALNLQIKRNKVDHKFVLNEAGYVVKVNGLDYSLPFLRFETEKLPAYQDQFFTPDQVRLFLDINNYFVDQFNLQLTELIYYRKERELHLLTERSFTVWLDLEADFRKQLDKLKDAVPKLNIYQLNLEYIDLRIEGIDSEKLIYKLR